ncbi:MAG: N-acetylmuramic acid 6-phosphate etherase [Chitinophagales bacterium]|jgi:N-acetylmuramic acid 6-phosphate etherase
MIKTTEQDSNHRHLENMSTKDLLLNMNKEDQSVPKAVAQCIPQIEQVVDLVSDKLLAGGRLFYIGAGTSGRLGVLDASECPPTFGVSDHLVIGIISGGDKAIRKAVEFAEDSQDLAWKDLQEYDVNPNDVVIGIAASGTTPYVIAGLEACNKQSIQTACITCNEGSPLAEVAKYPIECVVGPEFVTGSTRMKSGTAQKLILNMISTSAMIKIGRVEDNKMVNMQLSNHKLLARGVKMIRDATRVDETKAKETLLALNSVKLAIEALKK